jgi:hypothetical protein
VTAEQLGSLETGHASCSDSVCACSRWRRGSLAHNEHSTARTRVSASQIVYGHVEAAGPPAPSHTTPRRARTRTRGWPARSSGIGTGDLGPLGLNGAYQSCEATPRLRSCRGCTSRRSGLRTRDRRGDAKPRQAARVVTPTRGNPQSHAGLPSQQLGSRRRMGLRRRGHLLPRSQLVRAQGPDVSTRSPRRSSAQVTGSAFKDPPAPVLRRSTSVRTARAGFGSSRPKSRTRPRRHTGGDGAPRTSSGSSSSPSRSETAQDRGRSR